MGGLFFSPLAAGGLTTFGGFFGGRVFFTPKGCVKGGVTTTDPDATPPAQLSVKTWGVGGDRGHFGGARLEGVCGGGTHCYHTHTSKGDVCLGVWAYGGM